MAKPEKSFVFRMSPTCVVFEVLESSELGGVTFDDVKTLEQGKTFCAEKLVWWEKTVLSSLPVEEITGKDDLPGDAEKKEVEGADC